LYTSARIRAAGAEEERSLTAVKTLSNTEQVTLPGRLFDWLRYPFQRRAFQRLLQEKFQGFPWLASAWGDYRLLEAEHKVLQLVARKRPAVQAAAEVREAGRKRAEAERRAKIAEHLLNYYETLFPWLADFRSEDVEELLVVASGVAEQEEGRDPARRWLTEAEYEKLSSPEKYQLALDRYWIKKKSRWEVGRDYERYIGYKYESEGFAVRYQGIVEGFEDLGRDLIAAKNGTAEVVQCKYWSEHKTIHEKHIFQLFGTVTAYRLDHPTENVTGVFVTSTRLSDRARQFADILDIQVQETVPLERYPCVKCNVSRRTGEKIYHLPFDQQYDKTIIEEERLERYVSTAAEAEMLGFRRAKRWLGGHEEQARERSSSRRRRKRLTN
jgi:hypothetical protein